MCPSFCRSFLAFLLKFLNFLQAVIGFWIILYSIWMLNRWNQHGWIPPDVSPSPENSMSLFSSSQNHVIPKTELHNFWYPGQAIPLKDSVEAVIPLEDGFQLRFKELPDPWFIYCFMGIGIMLCLITCIGYISAEAVIGCCLCCYILLTFIPLLLEATLVCFIVLDKHWEKDLPYDPTGELENLRLFIKDNIYICKWVGIVIVSIQTLSLLSAMILRAILSNRRIDYDSDDDYSVIRGTNRQPLLNPQIAQNSASNSIDIKGFRPDSWSTGMRQKYGVMN